MIIHQVWVGGPVPPGILRLYDAWDEELAGTDHRMVRWFDEQVEADPRLSRLVDRLTTKYPWMQYRGLSDFIRLAILREYGGVYVDSDSLPLNINMLAVWDAESPWIGNEPHRVGKVTLNNAFFGFPRQHEFLTAALSYGFRRLSEGVRNEHFVIGPRAWRVLHNSPVGQGVTVYNTVAELFYRDLPAPPYDLAALAATYAESPVLHTIFNDKDVE